MAITTILCDLDGTLVDSRLDITTAFQHAWKAVIGGIPPQPSAIARHIGKPLAEMVHEAGELLSPAALSAFLSAYHDGYVSQESRLSQPYPEVIDALQALSHFMLGVVTTKGPREADIVLRCLGLSRFFRCVQAGTPGLGLKPAPDGILAALATLDCLPTQALMVGDTPADIGAGRAAGVMTCAVTYGYSRREALLHSGPDHLIDTFGELVALVRSVNAHSSCGR
jgi:HAD superfamily hydrolase (TIGR01509 family)